MDAPTESSSGEVSECRDVPDLMGTINGNRAVMVFCPLLVRSLSAPPKGRLEPNYVGVRRVRPSSRMVKLEMEQRKRKADSGQKVSPVVFKVADDNGKERRMTKQEKKSMKLQMAQRRKVEKEQKRLEKEKQEPLKKKGKKRKRGTNANGPVLDKTTNYEYAVEQGNSRANDSAESSNVVAAHNKVQGHACGNDNGNGNIKDADSVGEDEIIKALSQVGIPAPKLSVVEQELADLRGERQGVPPVILSPPLARVAFQTPGLLSGHDSSRGSLDSCCCMDDAWAQDWTVALKESMVPALLVRGREDMRPMAYDIVPEVWSRLRPESLQTVQQQQQADNKKTATPPAKATATIKDNNQQKGESWGLVSIRPPSVSSFDSDLAAVTEVIYRNTALHVSCGAKFGCDLLLYDGPRKDRHAFAGLRLVVLGNTPASTAEMPFPVPSPYAVAGYVRCLNTAGKLALLALVRRRKQPDGSTRFHVAIVDLKLQHVDGSNRKGTDERLGKLTRS
jgi:hypothetical protein